MLMDTNERQTLVILGLESAMLTCVVILLSDCNLDNDVMVSIVEMRL